MEIQCDGFKFYFPYNANDKYGLFEMQSKGYLYGTILEIERGDKFQINFYDSTRFKQDVDDEIRIYGLFYEENVVLIEEITKEKVLAAINNIVDNELYRKMVPANHEE